MENIWVEVSYFRDQEQHIPPIGCCRRHVLGRQTDIYRFAIPVKISIRAA